MEVHGKAQLDPKVCLHVEWLLEAFLHLGTSACQTDSKKGLMVFGHVVCLTKPIMSSMLHLAWSLGPCSPLSLALSRVFNKSL